MSLKAYQKQIDDMVQGLEKPYWSPLSIMARMSEEVGEVARIINHKFGDKPKKPTEEHEDLADELADVMYTVLCMANSQGIDLDPAMEKVIAKLSTRDKDRFKKKA
ncbi:MAG: nucleotide pyrophosphohydrolase [Candidatus Saccharimonadales bacterium]